MSTPATEGWLHLTEPAALQGGLPSAGGDSSTSIHLLPDKSGTGTAPAQHGRSCSTQSEAFGTQSSSAALPVLCARWEVFVGSAAVLLLPGSVFWAWQFCYFCLNSCTVPREISKQRFQNTTSVPWKQRKCPDGSSAVPPSVGGFGHRPETHQGLCSGPAPLRPSPPQTSTAAKDPWPHLQGVTAPAAFLCGSQLYPDLSSHCSSLLQGCSNHLRTPQQITGFPTHSAQPLALNLIHYNMLIITLRLSQVPSTQALINPPGSPFSNTKERRKMCKRETLLINFNNKQAAASQSEFSE